MSARGGVFTTADSRVAELEAEVERLRDALERLREKAVVAYDVSVDYRKRAARAEANEILLGDGLAEQAHAGRVGAFSWLALRGPGGEFFRMPKIAGQRGRLIWKREDES